jgi:acetyl esterase/lipase
MSRTTLPARPAATELAYGPDPAQVLDVYLPDSPNGAAIIDIHGGGWWTGDKGKEGALAGALAGAGYVVFVPNYRLADGHANLYPTQNDDMTAVLGWAKASSYTFDRARIAAVGTSSGGNLSVEMAVRHSIPAVSWSGLMDLEGFWGTHPATTPVQLHLDAATPSADIDQSGANESYYKWLIINLLGGDMGRLHDATLTHRIDGSTGPLYLANSAGELVPVAEVFKVAAAMVDAGRPVQTQVIPGAAHAEGYLDDAVGPTLEFLARHLG